MMTQSIRATIVAVGLLAALTGGTWGRQSVLAQGGPAAGAAQKPRNGREGHPVLQNSMRQLESIKDRLQKAPTDFGGHREGAVDAINRAINELQQAIQFDRR
jgi:hypothetical protein